MKKLTLTTIVLVLCTITLLHAQNCLPDGVIFYNQASIDNFQTDYPDCTHIEGDVTIGNDGYLTDITNLDGLNAITAIDGNVHIITNVNLMDFSGLGALESIGGFFKVEDNDLITDFNGLGSLETIQGEFYVLENDELLNFSGLTALTTVNGDFKIGHHLKLETFNGLSALTYIGGLEINYAHAMQSLDGMYGLTTVGGNVRIVSCHGLINLAGINYLNTVNGNIYISENPALETLLGLEALTTVGGNLDIASNDALTSLTALSYLTSIGGDLTIAGQDILASITGLEALTSIGGKLNIQGNNQLSSLTGIDNISAQSINELSIRYNPILSDCDVLSVCNYLASPGGTINITNNASGCNSQEEVTASCGLGIYDPSDFISLSVFPNPAHNEIQISSNENVTIEKISIYNYLGKLLIVSNGESKKLDVSELSTGVYMMVLTTEQGEARRKIIIE